MNISDVVLMSKNTESFSNLLALNTLTTKKATNHAIQNGYIGAISLKSFKAEYPDIDTSHIFFSLGFGSSYYWDEKSMIIFPLHLINGKFLSPTGETLSDYIKSGIRIIGKNVEKKDFYFIITSLNDRMRIEYLNMLIDKDIPNIYQLFLDIYTNSDYGFSCLSKESIQKVITQKSKKEINQTQNILKSFPDVLTIYRGCGSESSNIENAYSWTIESSVALFLATRFDNKSPILYKAKVKTEDIWEFIDNEEKECLILPNKLFDIEEFPLYSTEYLSENMYKIADDYLFYKEKANYRKYPFSIYSELHGREHSMRVLFFCMLLANMKNLSIKDKDILAQAAVYHDIGRTNDEKDDNHGLLSVKKYNKNANPIILFLMEYHCKSDEQGIAFIESDPYLTLEKEKIKLLYSIFKDADALDRVRLGKFELDFEQLRTEEAKKLPAIANITLSQLKNL